MLATFYLLDLLEFEAELLHSCSDLQAKRFHIDFAVTAVTEQPKVFSELFGVDMGSDIMNQISDGISSTELSGRPHRDGAQTLEFG